MAAAYEYIPINEKSQQKRDKQRQASQIDYSSS